MRNQSGFTLIELVVVMVLLGILGAVATAKYQDLSGAAQAAAIDGVASEMAAASAINYAADVTTTPAVSINAVATACSSLGGLFQTGAPPAGYALSDTAVCGPTAIGTTQPCTLTHTASTLTRTVNVICTRG
ncbi:MAG: type II secretion system protein [Gammaproteobacteria bacterium]|nr:type II secretion system protein [Gammaproteobacteria bacterium]